MTGALGFNTMVGFTKQLIATVSAECDDKNYRRMKSATQEKTHSSNAAWLIKLLPTVGQTLNLNNVRNDQSKSIVAVKINIEAISLSRVFD
jgi:argininosuccinate lyase